MTPESRRSSNSWSRSGAAPPPDIIDLDRYMRAARPPAPARARPLRRDQLGERLVVDSGGARDKVGCRNSYSTSCAKRYSHDSGLSDDGSYGPRPRNPARRGATSHSAPRATHSTHSMRKFRVACERALRDQQQQIARVARLCDRLTAVATGPPRPSPPRSLAADASLSSDSSDSSYTSRSRSERDRRRKDNIRSGECKTYKIIMSKLDELNRVFMARGRSPTRPGTGGGVAAARRPRALLVSSGSVSVSDKVVATESQLLTPQLLAPNTAAKRLVERAVGQSLPSSLTCVQVAVPGHNASYRLEQPRSPRCVCPAQHVATVHRLLKCPSTEEMDCSVLRSPRRADCCADDGGQVYRESKRAHSCRRTRSADSGRGLPRDRAGGAGAA
ncbi:uncharacterized protein LOC113229534, partial [Hyposmocoma kahamanoa]|uniref:uncharacterized protein LOC113229534 n=1 Tax=Hyposmocoma kahamanoa TaxID=1477025 RepID=UPI000E6D87A6